MTEGLAYLDGRLVRAGDVVEVRSEREILATLDAAGRLDGLPFMPEMLEFCGRRFRVASVAHKTCDSATFSGGRRMRDAVFLEDLRCDGAAHGGCQARCLLFWKTQWLKRAPKRELTAPADAPDGQPSPLCDHDRLVAAAQTLDEQGRIRYSCQATEHMAATEPLRPLAAWHFIADLRTGNVRLRDAVKVLTLHLVWRLRFAGFGWRASTWLFARLHRWITGRPDPYRAGLLPEGARTPEERLDLQPGEWVEVKNHDEILATIDRRLRNRGLAYNSEMTPACGHRYRVAQRVTRIVEEKSGYMLTMKSPCITLEGFYCEALYTHYSLLCRRRATPYFREIWLKRAREPSSTE